MPNNRNHFIGARFNKEEKDYIRNMANERNMSVSDLVREAIFSHLNFLESNKGKIEKMQILLIKQDSTEVDKLL